MDWSEFDNDFFLLVGIMEFFVDGCLVVSDVADDEFVFALNDHCDDAATEDAISLFETLLFVEISFDIILQSI